MPIEERELEKMTGLDSREILSDRPCPACGYNLKGLKAGNNCPECGRLITKRTPGSKWDDDITQSPLLWLRLFATGTRLLLLSLLVSMLSLLVDMAFTVPPELIALVDLLATLFWAGGVWLATMPRPCMSGSMIQPRREWFWLRSITRAGLFFLLISGVADVLEASLPSMSIWFLWASFVAGFLGLASMVAACILFSHYAYWAADSRLTGAWRVLAYLYAAWTVVALFPIIGLAYTSAMPVMMLLFKLGAVLVGLPIVLIEVYSLWRFNSIAVWAVRNHRAAAARAQRFREKAQAEFAAAQKPRG